MSPRLHSFEAILSRVRDHPERCVGIPGAEEHSVLEAVLEARRRALCRFILFGDERRLREILEKEIDGGEALLADDGVIVEPVDDPAKGIAAVTAMAVTGDVDIILKGRIPTPHLLRTVLREGRLRTGWLLSDVMVFEDPVVRDEDPATSRLMCVTDGGVNILPSLEEKRQIIMNAVSLFHSLGFDEPRVACLSASEIVTDKLPSTLDADRLKQWNASGHLTGCVVDGPLAIDLAISIKSVHEKGFQSAIAGDADILLVPNIESGNILGKLVTYYGHAPVGHTIIGSRVPILIPSRSDDMLAKLNSIALGILAGAREEVG